MKLDRKLVDLMFRNQVSIPWTHLTGSSCKHLSTLVTSDGCVDYPYFSPGLLLWATGSKRIYVLMEDK